jgi:hypothetical protein
MLSSKNNRQANYYRKTANQRKWQRCNHRIPPAGRRGANSAMTFPLNLWDISLLLALEAIILLITSELLSVRYGIVNIFINRKRLRNTAITFAMLFLATSVIKIAEIILYQYLK